LGVDHHFHDLARAEKLCRTRRILPATEKQYEKRTYLVPKSTLDPFFKDRAELLAKKPSPSPTPASGKKR
jgi:hypothetical protein